MTNEEDHSTIYVLTEDPYGLIFYEEEYYYSMS